MKQLLEAVSQGDLKKVKSILAKIDSPVSNNIFALTYHFKKFSYGRHPEKSPLRLAIENNNSDIVEMLLQLKAKTTHLDEHNSTALHWAVRSNATACANIILKYQKNIDERDGFDSSALMLACYLGHEEIAILLMNNGANIFMTDKQHCSTLDLAVKHQCPRICQKALDIVFVAILNHKDIYACSNIIDIASQYAANSNHTKIILLFRRFHQNISKNTLINPDKLKTLRTQRNLIRMNLDEALSKKDILEFRRLLHSIKKTPSLHGTWLGFYQNRILDEVIRYRVNETLLMRAARAGKSKFVFFLIRYGASLDLTTKQGNTALHFACMEGHNKIAEYLVNQGADPYIKNADGYTALDIAEQRNKDHTLRPLQDVQSFFDKQNAPFLLCSPWKNNHQSVIENVEKNTSNERKNNEYARRFR